MKRAFRWTVVADRGWTKIEVAGVHNYDDAKDFSRWYYRKNSPKSVSVEDQSGRLAFFLDDLGETEWEGHR